MKASSMKVTRVNPNAVGMSKSNLLRMKNLSSIWKVIKGGGYINIFEMLCPDALIFLPKLMHI